MVTWPRSIEAGLVPEGTERVKIMLSGELKKAVTLKDRRSPRPRARRARSRPPAARFEV